MGLAETKAAITAADKAFQTWGKTTAKVSQRDNSLGPCVQRFQCFQQYRHDILMKFHKLMQDNHDDLGRIIVSDVY